MNDHPLRPEERAEIRVAHVKVWDHEWFESTDGSKVCQCCRHLWPCLTIRLLDELEQAELDRAANQGISDLQSALLAEVGGALEGLPVTGTDQECVSLGGCFTIYLHHRHRAHCMGWSDITQFSMFFHTPYRLQNHAQ